MNKQILVIESDSWNKDIKENEYFKNSDIVVHDIGDGEWDILKIPELSHKGYIDTEPLNYFINNNIQKVKLYGYKNKHDTDLIFNSDLDVEIIS